MDTFDRDYHDDPRYKGHRDNISAFVEPRPVDPKKVCDVFNQTQLLHGPTARQYKLESPPLSVVDLLLLSISRLLKLLAAIPKSKLVRKLGRVDTTPYKLVGIARSKAHTRRKEASEASDTHTWCGDGMRHWVGSWSDHRKGFLSF